MHGWRWKERRKNKKDIGDIINLQPEMWNNVRYSGVCFIKLLLFLYKFGVFLTVALRNRVHFK